MIHKVMLQAVLGGGGGGVFEIQYIMQTNFNMIPPLFVTDLRPCRGSRHVLTRSFYYLYIIKLHRIQKLYSLFTSLKHK